MDIGHIYCGAGFRYIMLNYPPKQRIGFADHACYGQDRHFPHQGDDQRFKEQSELGTFPSPGDGHLMYPVLRARHARYAGMEIGLMLKEVHVPPGMFTGVVYGALLATDRASEAATSGKVDVQVQQLLFHREGHMIHQLRRNQTYRE